MTTPKPPGKPGSGPTKPGAKPFLGDDDLSELDAWVETFDALHAGPEPGTEAARAAAAAAQDSTQQAAPPPNGAGGEASEAGEAGEDQGSGEFAAGEHGAGDEAPGDAAFDTEAPGADPGAFDDSAGAFDEPGVQRPRLR